MSVSEERHEIGPRAFEVRVDPDRDRVTVTPVGELDLLTAPELRRDVEGLLDRGFDLVRLDLRELEFVDSQGIRALLAVHRRAQEQGAQVTIVIGNEVTRRALEICGVLPHLHIQA